MPKKKKEKLAEKIREAKNLEDKNSIEDGAHPGADSVHPLEAQDQIVEGEAIPGGETPVEDHIPLSEKLALIQAALETSEAKAAEYLDGWQRAQAEFTNYRKRQERDRDLAYFETVGRVAKRYLPIVDDLERALKDRPAQGDGSAWADGIELVYRKLLTILEAEGVSPIAAVGEMFDPTLHEAVVQSESAEHESGQVIEVLQTGYKMGERVLRPAVVRVAA